MKVAVGSSNPAKLSAVKEAFTEALKVEVEVFGISVDSGVSNQPFGDETIDGAYNRAEKVLEASDADFGVGIEGGIMRLGEKWYNFGFVVINDGDGNIGTGSSGWFECPNLILDEIKKGSELGDVMDRVSGTKDSKKKAGAIGILTRNIVTRKDLYKHGVLMALVPFMNKSLWSSH
jgi:inosine/xanthosine triphosphatase